LDPNISAYLCFEVSKDDLFNTNCRQVFSRFGV
jgi:hypothetical protein